jgi:hypothetical protein
MSASVAPSPPTGDIFLPAKQSMAEAALTYDFDYPMEDGHRKCLAAAHKLDEDFDKARAEKLKTNTKLVTGEVVHSDHHLIARVNANIRAPINQALAYFFAHHQQYQDHTNFDTPDVMLDVYFDRTPRSVFTVNQYKSPFPLANREYVTLCTWEKLSDGSFHFAAVSADHSSYPITPDFVRMTVTRSARLVAISPSLTHVVVTSEVNLGGRIPRAVNDAITVPMLAGTCLRMMTYFSHVRSPDAYDAGDAVELGKLAFLKLRPLVKHPEELRDAVTKMIARNDVMREFQSKYEFLDEILCTVVRNQISQIFDRSEGDEGGSREGKSTGSVLKRGLTKLSSSKVPTRAIDLTARDASRIASKFSLVLLSNTTSDAAVDEWFLSFPALGELGDEFTWFKPAMEGTAALLLAETPFGVKLRAYVGAALSMFDMASDSYVIRDMFASGRVGVAVPLLAMVCANILLQLAVVWCQNRKVQRKNNGWLMLKECLYVVTFIKPGVEAFRVASGHEELPGAVLTPLQEMAYAKCVELFSEAAPGMTLQSIALITSKKKSRAALLSILISAGCAAMTSATLTYDTDTSPAKRKTSPDMCGMIPDTGRGMAFFVMVSISFLQVTAKCVSVALLGVTNVQWLVYYLGGDMALYFTQKILRQDFTYHLPLPSAADVPISIVIRIISKTVADFSGAMVLRTATELGGAYFCFNLASSITSVPVITHLYLEHATVEDDDAEKLDAQGLWTFSIGIVVMWAAVFGYFLWGVVVPKYRMTFCSMQTGRERSESTFLDNEEDELRIAIFRKNVVLWSRIKEDVTAWTVGSWETWDREKPEWFTKKVISRVPDEFIPPRFLTKLGSKRKRRGSAAGSVKESLRGLEEGGEGAGEGEEPRRAVGDQ